MNAKEITKIMAIIATEYPRQFDITEERVKLWQAILAHAQYSEASFALATVLSEARPFPPAVGEINQAILSQRVDNRRRIAATTQQALPEPPIPPEKAKAMFKKLVEDLAAKKAMRQ
jgi:hypothetical protein